MTFYIEIVRHLRRVYIYIADRSRLCCKQACTWLWDLSWGNQLTLTAEMEADVTLWCKCKRKCENALCRTTLSGPTHNADRTRQPGHIDPPRRGSFHLTRLLVHDPWSYTASCARSTVLRTQLKCWPHQPTLPLRPTLPEGLTTTQACKSMIHEAIPRCVLGQQ